MLVSRGYRTVEPALTVVGVVATIGTDPKLQGMYGDLRGRLRVEWTLEVSIDIWIAQAHAWWRLSC